MRKAGRSPWNNAAVADFVTEATPPAKVSLLAQVDDLLVAMMSQPWAQPALCFDGMTSGLETRRFEAILPGPCLHARGWISLCGDTVAPQDAETIQSDTIVRSSSSGGFGGGAVDITVPAQAWGTVAYLDTTTILAAVKAVRSGATVDDTPAATVDRLIELTAGLAPAVEVIETVNVCGFGLQVVHQTEDLETL